MIATIDNKIKMEKLQPKLRFPEFYGDWSNYLIKEILTIGSGKDYKHLSQGEVPVFGTGGLMTKVNSFLYDGETVCIGRKGTIDKPFFHSGKIWTVDTLFYSHSFIDSLPKFVFYSFLRINWKQHNEAGGVPSLSKSTIECISIFLPKLDEQSKIASFLSSVDEKLNLLKDKKEALETYKKGMMQKIFSKELRFKDDDGNEFPEWEEIKIGDIGEIITGKTPSTNEASLWGGDVQFVTPTDISESKYQYNSSRYVVNNKKLKILPKNSILFTCIASIGKMSMSVYPCITNQQINAIVPNKEFENEFVFYSLLYISEFIKSTQSNTTLPIINKTDFSNFYIFSPIFKEQTKIANFLSAIDDKITLVSTQIEETQAYKKGLLQGMFC